MSLPDFVQENKPDKSFYIRPFIYTSDLCIAPRLHKIKKDFFVYGLELGDYLPPDGITCRISSWYRQEDRSLPLRGKISGAYITSSLAKTEAVESGFDEAILMNSQGKICEASGMNIFIVRNGKLFAPDFDQDILEGITRDSVITIAKDLGIEVIERPIDKTELFIADEVFLSGTAAKITPVKCVENYYLPESKPITEKLREKLTLITKNGDPTYQDWKDKYHLSLDQKLPKRWFPRLTFDCTNWQPKSIGENLDKGDDFLDEGLSRLEFLASDIHRLKYKYM